MTHVQWIDRLRRDLAKQGLTPHPVCPTCHRMIAAAQWDAHPAGCTAWPTADDIASQLGRDGDYVIVDSA